VIAVDLLEEGLGVERAGGSGDDCAGEPACASIYSGDDR